MKYLKNTLIILLINILFVSPCIGQEEGFSKLKDIDSFTKKINETAKTTKTIECKFKQEKYLSFLSEKVVSKGAFYFKSPQKLRWEYQKPFKYIIIINDGSIIIKDDDKENKFDTKSNKMFKEINEILIGCVNGDLLSKKDKFKSVFFESDKFYLAQLTPVSGNISGFLKTVNIYFDKKDLTVSKLKMFEPSGDNTIIYFSDKKINKGVSDEIFSVR